MFHLQFALISDRVPSNKPDLEIWQATCVRDSESWMWQAIAHSLDDLSLADYRFGKEYSVGDYILQSEEPEGTPKSIGQ